MSLSDIMVARPASLILEIGGHLRYSQHRSSSLLKETLTFHFPLTS